MKIGNLIIGWFVTCAVLGLGLIGFVIWVIIELMYYFGVIGG